MHGGPLSESVYDRWWKLAREQALTPAQVASPLARRPYDLRHAAASLWLNAGVPATEVARRLGHSVAVLLRVYANCIDGGDAGMNDRTGGALDGPKAAIAMYRYKSDVLVEERDRFDELTGSPYFDQIVAANRLYLTAAVTDALESEKTHWALSCLPTTGGNSRFSTLSISGQETFAAYKPGDDGVLMAHVFVSKSVLKSFGADFDHRGLEILVSPYVTGGEDQSRVLGSWQVLAPALASRPLRVAARSFAERLLPAKTSYSRYHNDRLAGHVLGRS